LGALNVYKHQPSWTSELRAVGTGIRAGARVVIRAGVRAVAGVGWGMARARGVRKRGAIIADG
jgi:hypothetical protein